MVSQITNNGSRLYLADGKSYPSVTTIIKATNDKATAHRLRRWKHKMDKVHGKGKADVISDERAREGTEIHAAIAHYLQGEGEMPDYPMTHPAKSYLKLFKTCNRGVEMFIKQPHPYGYAGTLDLIADFEGKLTVLDWTTSNRVKIKDWVQHKFLQCAAYANAYYEMTGQKPLQLGVIVLTTKRCQVFTDDPERYGEEWQARLNRFYDEGIAELLGLDIITR